ncbi:MAG TPA: hypothetical protein VEG44_10115 [Candidatus Acidoferrales bacterium]|nr:hypothetical protein [Candidatus Acidoferrales bacterium]
MYNENQDVVFVQDFDEVQFDAQFEFAKRSIHDRSMKMRNVLNSIKHEDSVSKNVIENIIIDIDKNIRSLMAMIELVALELARRS